MSDFLTSICIEQHTLMMRLDSGSTISAFSRIRFLSHNGRELSAFDVATTDDIQIPARRYIGQPLIGIREGDGFVDLDFGEAGRICLARISNEPEVALLVLNGEVRVVV